MIHFLCYKVIVIKRFKKRIIFLFTIISTSRFMYLKSALNHRSQLHPWKITLLDKKHFAKKINIATLKLKILKLSFECITVYLA